MKRFAIFLGLCLALACPVAGATDTAEARKDCGNCGMDLDFSSRSRMVIIYADRSAAAVCSLHCAAALLKKHGSVHVHSLKVADYGTGELTDAAKATWVIGGAEKGVKTSQPKWAFVREEDARNFVREHGGDVTPFDQVMKAAAEEVEDMEAPHEHGAHMGHDVGHAHPGAQMLYNPAFGDDIYHTHPAGMWMVNYKFMRMDMGGLRVGTKDVPVDQVIPVQGTPFGFMMAPTRMTMDMHMVMAMYGVTDRLTLMGMATYPAYEMEMLMNMGMGMGNVREPPMRTSGIGDTEVRGIYGIDGHLVASLGLGIPTGDIKQEFGTMGRTFRAPYGMQLGSGTFDLKPAFTYNALSADAAWNWGAQAGYTAHLGKNDADYSRGDSAKVTGWIQRAFGPASAWLRLAYDKTGRIRGRDAEIQKLLDPDPTVGASSPGADPDNYGGQRIDGLIGVSITKGCFSAGVEGGVPLYQELNGLQLETDWLLTVGFQSMF